jgi:ribonuclease D
VIANEKTLAPFLTELERTSWVAVDTEADSLYAYPEKLCLLQISIPGADVLVDTLASFDLQPLWEKLRGRELILHGSDYDLRLFNRCHRFVPDQMFDTMIAARLLGYEQFSLSSLVERHLGIKLEKGPQKANWAQRPLSPRMEEYARNDTRHLRTLEQALRAELTALGRLEWHREFCQRLVEEARVVRSPDPNLEWRMKGSQLLDRQALTILRELWYWREREAIQCNRPPFFILAHDTLSALAEAAVNNGALDPLMPRRMSQRRRDTIRDAILRGLEVPAAKQAQRLQTVRRHLTEAQKSRLQEFEQRRNRQAEKLGLEASFIASRATLVALASEPAAEQELMQWQRGLLMTG